MRNRNQINNRNTTFVEKLLAILEVIISIFRIKLVYSMLSGFQQKMGLILLM